MRVENNFNKIFLNNIKSFQNVLYSPQVYNNFHPLITEFSSEANFGIKSAVLPKINFTGINNKKTIEQINKTLLEEYGIDSKLTNLDAANLFLESVEDFVKINTKNMFKGLKLSDLTGDNIYSAEYDTDKDYFEIFFQNNFNKADIEDLAKIRYERGYTASDNKKYMFYDLLGRFLCFKENPYAYNFKCQYRAAFGDRLIAARKLGILATLSYSLYNSNYIAAKMCRVPTTERMDSIYEDLIGADIDFPQPKNTEIKGEEFSFKSVEDAQNYLKQYNIKSNFHDLKSANLTVGAIEDFIKVNKNKNLFNGLEISYKITEESWSGATISSFDDIKNEMIESYIVLNIACNWKKPEKVSRKGYNTNHSSSNSPKSTMYHELGHWLHFHNDPLRYDIMGKKYSENEDSTKLLSDYERDIFGRVSNYATKSPLEFVAEYITARMSGHIFPKAVDNQFENFYGKGNVPLRFPKIKN